MTLTRHYVGSNDLNSPPLLKATNLKKSFGVERAVNDISFSLEKGEIVAAVGQSGAGKSTLLRLISHLDTLEAGHIELNGIVINPRLRGHKEGSVRWLRQQLGIVFQDFGLWPHFTVLENLLEAPLAHRLDTHDQLKEQAFAWLERVGLTSKAHAYPTTLSGGQQQRIALIRALLTKPKVLLADEPTSALDPGWTKTLQEIFCDYAKAGGAILIVTHDIPMVRNIAHRVLFLDKGSFKAEGLTDEMFNQNMDPQWKTFLQQEPAYG